MQALERPILFSTAMVRAILAGAKTQTRRPMISMDQKSCDLAQDCLNEKEFLNNFPNLCPYGRRGDLLWVRETWAVSTSREGTSCAIYKADGRIDAKFESWSPSIHMPRWASRLTLRITRVRAQRLQDMSKKDCIAEGQQGLEDVHAGWHQNFAHSWDAIYKARRLGWDKNPWVWVLDFEKE